MIEFYKQILKMAGLTVNEAGQIFIEADGMKIPFMISGLEAYLPTPINIREATKLENGEVVVVKHIFHPLEESAVTGANASFNKYKTALDLKLFGLVSFIGEYLFKVLGSSEKIDDVDVIDASKVLSNYHQPGVKVIIDDNTSKKWTALYKAVVKNYKTHAYLTTSIKKGGTIDKVKFRRTAVVTHPFIEMLDKNPKNEPFLDVKLRGKDKFVFTALLEYLFYPKETLLNGKSYGSLNNTAPSLHSLLLSYDAIYETFNNILTAIVRSGVEDEKLYEMVKIPFGIQNLDSGINGLETEIRNSKETTVAAVVTSPVEKPVTSGWGTLQANMNNEPVNTQQNITQPTIAAQPAVDSSNGWGSIDRNLAEHNRNAMETAQVYNQQQQLLAGQPASMFNQQYQQPMQQQPMQQQPMQQQYQQPMQQQYQQPMQQYQQQQYQQPMQQQQLTPVQEAELRTRQTIAGAQQQQSFNQPILTGQGGPAYNQQAFNNGSLNQGLQPQPSQSWNAPRM